MADVESIYEVTDDNGTTIGNIDLQSMRDEILKSNRTIEHLKQEVQQLKSQVRRTQTQLKMLASRLARR